MSPEPQITRNPDGTFTVTFTREQAADFLADMAEAQLPHTSTSDTTDTVLIELLGWYRDTEPALTAQP